MRGSNLLLFSLLIYLKIDKLFGLEMSQIMKTAEQGFPKTQDEILKHVILSTTKIYSIYCHEGSSFTQND